MSDIKWEQIRLSLDQIEQVLGMERSEAPIAVRLTLIAEGVIAQRTYLEQARRQAEKWRVPVLQLYSAMISIKDAAQDQGGGGS